MQDILSMIASLNRPRLLVQAARFGVDSYNRELHLGRLLGTLALPWSGPAILRLLEIEAGLNVRRTTHAADYSIARHVEILIAIMGEARQMRALTRAA